MTDASVDVLAFKKVSFAYRGDWLQRIVALKDVTLRVPTGSAFGFLGANGAGKSTSLKLVMGLLHGHRGDITLFGQPLGDHRLRARIGFLPEQPYFYDNLDVGEYLSYLAHLSGVAHAAIPGEVDRVCKLLDLDELKQRKLRSFSKGMRQRFGLAQAIIHRPDLLILDEPFSGLDPLWRARFREIMRLERQRGATLCFCTHVLSDVEDLCDHYAVIDHGMTLEQGRLADLVQQAPLVLIGGGARPDSAREVGDGTWTWEFPETERERVLAGLPAGAQVLRLERHRLGLEDYFVSRVKAFHAAGQRLGQSQGGKP
jgi:ABC-2 type transport system ATP-binding protein